MQVYVFQNTRGWWGFTLEASGSNLPVDRGPWTPHHTVLLILKDYPEPRRGVKEAEILDGIDKQGYYLTTDTEVSSKIERENDAP